MKENIRVIMTVVAIFLSPNGLPGQDHSRAKEFFDSLVSKNTAPKIIEIGSGEVIFPKDFDWTEYRRSLQLMAIEVPKRSEEIWPILVDLLEDQRYVSTVATNSGAKMNVTVGDACMILIRGTLTGLYLRSAPKSINRNILAAQLVPEFFDSHDDVKNWLTARKDQPVYKLQIEVCEWAKKEVSTADFARLKDTERENWIGAINEVIVKLEKEKKLIPTTQFSTFESLSPRN